MIMHAEHSLTHSLTDFHCVCVCVCGVPCGWQAPPVFITGAEGPYAHKVIGKYMATGDVQNGRSLFHNSANDTWLYYASDNKWCVSTTKYKDAMEAKGFAKCMEPNLFDPTHGKTWKVAVDGMLVEQGSLVVSHDLSQVCAALPPCVPVSDHA